MTPALSLAVQAAPKVDYTALLPEIIVAAVLSLVLLADLFLDDDRKPVLMPMTMLGILGALGATLFLASGDDRATLGGMFVVDDFALLFKVIFLLASLFVVGISYDYLKDDEIHTGEFHFLLLSSLLGMLAIASSRDLLAIFVALELVTLPSFVLAGIRKSDLKGNEAALKFFLFGVLSAAVMLFGMSLIYGLTGHTNLQEIDLVIRQGFGVGREVALLSVFFVVVGFGFKVSAFPFQWWVPDTYEGSPVPVAAFLSVASKTAGFVGLMQVLFIGFIGLAEVWAPMLAVVAALTMTFGNLVALQQRHIVRLLAYSSIGQAGYILLPLGLIGATTPQINQDAFTAAIVYLLIYAFMETGAFAVAVAYGKRGGGYQVTDYAGLFQRSPGVTLAMTAFLFSLAGVPPFAGWAAKFFVFRVAINAEVLWLAAVMAVNTVIALFYYAAVAKQMFSEPTAATGEFRPPVLARTVIAIAAVVVLIIGVLPDLFGQLASGAATFLAL